MKKLLIQVATKVRDQIALEAEVLKAKQAVGGFYLVNNCICEVEGLRVFLDDTVVLANTGARSHQVNAVAFQNGTIVVNTAASQLPAHILEALVYHEAAHVKKAHKPNPILYPAQATLGFGYGLQMEYEADEYALAKGARVVELLEVLIEANGSNRALRLRLARAKALSNAV